MRKTVAILCLIALGAAAAVGAPTEKATTVSGTIARLSASERAIEVTLPDGSPMRLFWSPETKISGILTPGAKVTVRYIAGTDGKNMALQITVARG